MNKQLPIEVVGEFMQSAPVDLERLATAIGLEVIRTPLFDDLSGKIECEANGGPCKVTINSTHPRTRQRFTLAHEIAHFILHRDMIGDGIVDDCKYRSKGLSDNFERQANNYAANILMPWKLVLAKWRGGKRTPGEMAREFEVSEAVAEIRLKELRSILD